MRIWMRNLMRKIGYYCDGCNKYKKTFSPPYGHRVCLACQLGDADEHKGQLDDLIQGRRAGAIDDPETLERIGSMRERFLQSEAERRREKPVNPNGVFKVHGSPENRAVISAEGGNIKKDSEGNACPLTTIGGSVIADTGRNVRIVDLVYGEVGNNTLYAKCRAYGALKLIQGDDQRFYSPATEIPSIQCDRCPVVREAIANNL